MRPRFLYAFLLLSCLVSAGFLFSQATFGVGGQASAPTVSSSTHAPDPDSGMTGHVNGLYIPLITGQPFHAKIPVEITRTLPDGTTVAQKYYTLAARDADGREYREGRDLVPADSDRDPPLMQTIVYDPKTSLRTVCTPDQRICRRLTFDPKQHPVDEPTGPSSDGKSALTRESLGTKTIDGLECTGTRETKTFNPGAFGNDKPVVVTEEIWYSPQLQFNLSLTRLDPRNGNQKFSVVDLKLGDPGAEWFAMPDGYRLVSGGGIQTRSMYPAELEPVLEKSITGMTPDELTTALQPVEAAIGVYAKAHEAASPKDNNDIFAGQLRLRLSNDLRNMQQGQQMPARMQLADTDLRLNEDFREVVNSPCLNKPQPGDPPSFPSSADGLRAEETAWLAMRDAWSGFLTKLFPNSDRASFGWMITNERESDLRRMQNVERNRGCIPEESIEPLIVRYVTGLTSDQLEAAIKPVNAAINAYAKAHAESEPADPNQNFVRMTEQQLSSQVQMQQRNRGPDRGQFEEADANLNQVYRTVISSPCLNKPIPGDPPNVPVSEEKLRAEERAWVAMRDAWTAFMTTAFPNGNQAAFGTMLTQMRTNELQQIQNIERNRGCIPEESIEPLLVRFVHGMTLDQLDAAVKPVDTAIRAYAKAHAESEPNEDMDQNENFVRMTEQQLSAQLQMQQQNRAPTQDEFEEADLHLNQAFRTVISSSCLTKPIPGDPPNAPVSEEKLRAEERAWVDMRDAWTAFLATTFPGSNKAIFCTFLTQVRTGELQQIQNIERNRGCAPPQ